MSAMMKRARWASVLDRFHQVAAGRLVEVEYNGKVVSFSKHVQYNVEPCFSLRSEAPQNEDDHQK